jgi:hypothetical protein
MLAFHDDPAAQPVIRNKIKKYFIVAFLKKGVGPSSNVHTQPIHATTLAVALPGTVCTYRHTYYSWCNLFLFHQDQPAVGLNDF